MIQCVATGQLANRVRALWKAVRALCVHCEVPGYVKWIFFCHAAKKRQHISKLDSVQSGHVNLGYTVILEDLCMLA